MCFSSSSPSIWNMERCFKFLWLMALISSICLANARQIRYSRYRTEITEDDIDAGNIVEPFEIEATVREIKYAPYPAAGLRPSKPFTVEENESEAGNEAAADSLTMTTTEGYVDETTTTGADVDATEDGDEVKAPYPAAGFRPKIPFNLPDRIQRGDITTEMPQLVETTTAKIESEIPTTTTTYAPEVSTKVPLAEFTTRMPEIATQEPLDLVTDTPVDVNEVKAPYPPAGFRPRIPFNLPTENQVEEAEESAAAVASEEPNEEVYVKAPYPPSGYRPAIAFLLPSEQLKEEEMMENKEEDKEEASPKEDNSSHPACGSSTNPLAPKPADGAKKDPDAETIFVNPQTVVVPVRLTAQPLLLARPLVYTTHLRTW